MDPTGHLIVVMNGNLAIYTTIQLEQTLTGFENNLLLGTTWRHFQKLEKHQSEASVTNVNIFTGQLNLEYMKNITSNGLCIKGNLLSWNDATWTKFGTVHTEDIEGFCSKKEYPYLLNFPNTFVQGTDCLKICPRLWSNI